MVAKLVVKPKVVVGEERGGEDLYLSFECTEDGTEFEVEPEDGDLYWELDQDDETGETVGLSCKTEQYEFSWSGTLDDVLKIALDLGLGDKSTWDWCGKAPESPKLCWKCLFHVDGNAD